MSKNDLTLALHLAEFSAHIVQNFCYVQTHRNLDLYSVNGAAPTHQKHDCMLVVFANSLDGPKFTYVVRPRPLVAGVIMRVRVRG